MPHADGYLNWVGPVTRAEVGQSVTHRRHVPYSHAHYGGSLVDGASVLGMFGDVATELCIRTDADEGLFAGYASVAFEAPVRAGDVLEATAELVRVGTRSREVEFTARVLCRAASDRAPDRSASAADVLPEPVVVVRAEARSWSLDRVRDFLRRVAV